MGFWVQGREHWVQGIGFGCRVSGFGLMMRLLGSRVSEFHGKKGYMMVAERARGGVEARVVVRRIGTAVVAGEEGTEKDA